jgi:hypothetical protein
LAVSLLSSKRGGIMKELALSWSIQSLLTKCKAIFHISEDFKQYSKRDLKSVERKFLRYVLEQRSIEIEDELF